MAYQKRGFKKKTAEELKKEIDNLTTSIDGKVESYFESPAAIKEHLQFMANFYNYSSRNISLIQNQFSGAVAVGSYDFWKSKGAQVQKGEKGIKILVPAPVEYFKRGIDNSGKPNWVRVSDATPHEKQLIENGALFKKRVMYFKIGNVFEYSQTDARQKGLEVSQIFSRYHRDDKIENDIEFLKAFKSIADKRGIEILARPISELGTAKGAFYPSLNAIAMNPRNTLSENIPVMLHELAHAELHNQQREQQRERPLTTNEEEFQAELTAYVVAARYNIEMDDFSVPYLSSWTKDTTLEDKEQLLNEVKETATKFINEIDAHMEQANLMENQYDNTNNLRRLNFSIEKLDIEYEYQNLYTLNPNASLYEERVLAMGVEIYNNNNYSHVLSEPIMKIHGIQETDNFGKVNQLPFDEMKQEQFDYTLAYPTKEGTMIVSSSFNLKDAIHPLHDLDKNDKVPDDAYKVLENSWHSYLHIEEQAYIDSIMPRIRKEINALEQRESPKENNISSSKQQKTSELDFGM